MPIELRKPSRSDFTSDNEWLYACGMEAERYTKAMCRAIDAGGTYPSVDSQKRNAYDEQRLYGRMQTVNDYLQDKPDLLRRVKKYGASALFEI